MTESCPCPYCDEIFFAPDGHDPIKHHVDYCPKRVEEMDVVSAYPLAFNAVYGKMPMTLYQTGWADTVVRYLFWTLDAQPYIAGTDDGGEHWFYAALFSMSVIHV